MTKKFWITSGVIAGALLVGFVVIAVVLTSTGLVALPVDSAIANWAYSVRGDIGGACYWFFRIITEFGYVYFVIPFIVLMAIIWKFKGKVVFGWYGVDFLVDAQIDKTDYYASKTR